MKKMLDFSETKKQYNIASCGTKAMQQIILIKRGIEVPELHLMKIGNTSRKGTFVEGILNIADKFDLNYRLKHNCSINDLIESVDKGNPALLSVQAWSNYKVKDWSIEEAFGHWDILNGYDTREKMIYYYDPYDGKIKKIGYDTLHLTWHDKNFKKNIVYNKFAVFFEN